MITKQKRRSGTATVEFAFVAPFLFIVIFAMIEFGRAGMATHMLEGAARSGCRYAIVEGATEEEVAELVDDLLDGGGITTHTTTITPNPLASADQWDPVSVTITVSYDDISWLPLPNYFDGMQLSGSCTLPRESG